MSGKSRLLYELMLRKGYPEEFSRLICAEMSTDFTAEKMMSYVSGPKKRLEDVADEMVAIKDLRDRLISKHISEHANNSINRLYRDINEFQRLYASDFFESHVDVRTPSLRDTSHQILRQSRSFEITTILRLFSLLYLR